VIKKDIERDLGTFKIALLTGVDQNFGLSKGCGIDEHTIVATRSTTRTAYESGAGILTTPLLDNR